MNNCENCLYSNFMEDGSVMCDKRLLSENKEVYVQVDKIKLECPAHSSKLIEETKYLRNNKWLHEAEEGNYCEVCRREVDLKDITQYGYIEVQDEKGDVIGEKMQCRICRGEG